MAIDFSTGQTLQTGRTDHFYGKDTASTSNELAELPKGPGGIIPRPFLSLFNGATELYRWSEARVHSNVRQAPSLLVSKNAATTTSNEYPFQYDTVYRDTANGWNNSLRRYTIPVSGWYRVYYTSLIIPNAVLDLRVNGSRIFQGDGYSGGLHTNASSDVSYESHALEYMRNFTSGDFIEGEAWNGGGVYGYAWTYLGVDFVG